jgi:hypothetical protein
VERDRNWRSFLSVSKTTSWSEIRKQCMVWCLHGYRSEKYLRDENFKICLNARMRDPSNQLCLTFNDLNVQHFTQNPLSSNHFTQIPDFETLYALTLVNCSALTSVGNLNSLKILWISGCENLTYVGELARLTHFRLKTTRKDLLQYFSLETLKTLRLNGPRDLLLEFHQNAFRCCNLLELSLHHNSIGDNGTDLPMIALSSIVSLELMGFNSFDLSGLTNLKVLSYRGTLSENIKDPQNIISRVEKLSGFRDLCFDSGLDFKNLKFYQCSLQNLNHWDKISNIRELNVCDARDLKEETLTFGANVRSLTIHLLTVGSVNFLKCDRISKLCIIFGYFTNNDLSQFSQINHLKLTSLLNITDISSIKNVPVLAIRHYPFIENFSCLGSQRMLYVSHCMIYGKDFESLSRIPSLIIFSCVTLREVTQLHSSNYLSISYCSNLTDITLRGSQYLNVKINWCSCLTTVDITGRVYFFSILNCKSLIPGISEMESPVNILKNISRLD